MNTKVLRGVTYAIAFVLVVGLAAAFVATSASAQVFQVPTCSINSTASSGVGQPVTLSWNSSNATVAILSPGGGVSLNGSQLVYPTVTTTYSLAVHNASGQTGTCQTTVYVSGTTGSPTCSIYANPTNVNSGTSSTLTWTSNNATSATLSNHGSVSPSGSQVVTPTGTLTYTLLVYNAQGQSGQCQTTVTVGSTSGAPSCWISLNPQYTSNNQSATLTWGSQNATSAYISPNIGSVSTSGSQTVYTSGNQVYSMTVYGSGNQTATCQTSQYQTGNLSCLITANPSTVQSGQNTILAWASTGNAVSAWLSDGLGSVPITGTRSVNPVNSRTYTLTISDNQNRTQTCSAYVTVGGSGYPYVSLTQIPYTGFDLGGGGTALYWMALVLFALAAGYLVVYHMPNMFRTRRYAAVPTYTSYVGEETVSSNDVETPEIFKKGEYAPLQRVQEADALADLPVYQASDSDLKDSMTVATVTEGEAPRIIISRN